MRAALTGTAPPAAASATRSVGRVPPPACRQAAWTRVTSVQALDPRTDSALSTAWAAMVVSACRSGAGRPRSGGAVNAALSDVSRLADGDGLGEADGLVDGFGALAALLVVPAVPEPLVEEALGEAVG